MLEVISIIASLCLTPNGVDSYTVARYIQKAQLECQKYYLTCHEKEKSLAKCVLSRPDPTKEMSKL